jgi:hypothetical protein
MEPDPYAVFWDPRANPPFELAAELLQKSVYDTRLQLTGTVPRLLTLSEPADIAHHWVRRLVEAGGRAAACRATPLLAPDGLVWARTLMLDNPAQLAWQTQDGALGRVAIADIDLLLRARSVTQAMTTATVSESKFSLGKTIATGGIPMRKKVSKEVQQAGTVSERLELYVFAQRQVQPVTCIDAGKLDFSGLGRQMAAGMSTNFQTLCDLLSERTGRTIDNRLFERGSDLPMPRWQTAMAAAGVGAVTARMIRMLQLRG